MPAYVALIRAIGPVTHAKMRMAALRDACEDLGLEDVATVGNTGNIVFRTRKGAKAARALVQRYACTVVLKGSGTVIAAPDAAPLINPTGNARLASPGTGDVLTGMIAARLAAGAAPRDAAAAAVHAHGQAADCWPARQGLTASRLARLG